MAKKKAARRRSRFADDAALQALVRYEPEESGLKALAQQARADYGVSVRQAQTTGDLTLQAAREAIPAVSKIYDKAGLDQAGTANLVSPELAALTGPGAATLQRGGALEVAQQLGNLRSAKAAALEDLNTRAVAARQGQQYGILGARQKFTADMAKILGQSQSLQRQKGAFTASTIGSMTEAALGRELSARNSARSARTSAANSRRSAAQSERGSIRSSGIDPDTGKPIPGGKLDPATKKPKPGTRTATGRKLAPSGEHRTVRDNIAKGVQSLKTLDPERNIANWGPYGQLLEQGQKPITFHDPTTGKPVIRPNGTPKVSPDIPAIGHLPTRVALDLYYHRGITADTKRLLADAGYSVAQLGLAGRTARRKPKPLVPALKNPFSARVRG
jgi:hypothetical protein